MAVGNLGASVGLVQRGTSVCIDAAQRDGAVGTSRASEGSGSRCAGQLSGGRSQYDLSIPRTLSGLSLCSIMPVIVHKRLRVSARCGYRPSMVPRILLADFGLGEQWTVVGVKH